MSTPYSYDVDDLKQSLIEFVQSKPEFEDFNYEGSALNTVIDTLTRNTHYIAYMANMVATESFLDSAQLRANIVSHAQKLSFVPKTRTASTIVADILVTPSSPNSSTSIVSDKGGSFISSVANVSYQFTNVNSVVFIRDGNGNFKAENIELKQGQLLKQRFVYKNQAIEIPNTNIDNSTLRVYVRESALSTNVVEFTRVDDIISTSENSTVFYLSENSSGLSTIEFGKNVLGVEPDFNSIVEVEFIVVEETHANGLKNLTAASPVQGYSNISVTVKIEAYGGSERQSNTTIKFLAPKIYETQNRAVRARDYSTLLLRDFPFIKSAISWGGENNIPPYYGRVFISAIPETGFVISSNVKNIIETRLREFSMMMPELVDANYIGLDLEVGIIYDTSNTTDTVAQIMSNVNDVINDYNEELKSFSFWYNDSELSSRIKNINAIKSVEINKLAFFEQDIINSNSLYTIQFMNQVAPKSFKTSNVVLDVNATNQIIVDDGMGKIVSQIEKLGVVNTTNIGTINYDTGAVEFKANILNSGVLKSYIQPNTKNFYTDRNYVVYINKSAVNTLNNRRV